MGMFDKVPSLTKTEDFDPYSPFELFSGKFLGMRTSSNYGDNTCAEIVAGPKGSKQADGTKYMVYGVLADQIGRMESGDLPITVKVEKDGQANTFVKAS